MPERRQWPRYKIDWLIRLKGQDPSGAEFIETGLADNISANGAFGYVGRHLPLGTKLEVSIQVPHTLRENWLRYTAEIVRVESSGSGVGLALRFDTSRPAFTLS